MMRSLMVCFGVKPRRKETTLKAEAYRLEYRNKGKAIPLQALGFQEAGAPRFLDMKVVRLSALRTCRLYSFLLESESTPGP
jgi:hypothetical protein